MDIFANTPTCFQNLRHRAHIYTSQVLHSNLKVLSETRRFTMDVSCKDKERTKVLETGFCPEVGTMCHEAKSLRSRFLFFNKGLSIPTRMLLHYRAQAARSCNAHDLRCLNIQGGSGRRKCTSVRLGLGHVLVKEKKRKL